MNVFKGAKSYLFLAHQSIAIWLHVFFFLVYNELLYHSREKIVI